MNTIIQTDNLWKTYSIDSQRVEALKGINLEVKEGEFVVLIGPSGSGKSTLLHLLGAMDSPSQGEIILNGCKLSRMTAKERTNLRYRDIGFVFQTFNLLPTYSALENVEIPMRFSGMPRSERKERALELLEIVGLKDRINHLPKQLSGGQRQRVAIARALVNKPAIIFADEPTGNLDTTTGENIIELLIKLNSKGQTIFMVTHNNELANRATRKVNIRDGQLCN